MYLKDDAAEYVEQEKIKNIVKRYSEFINYPIKLFLSKDVRKEVEVEEEIDLEITNEDENGESEEPIVEKPKKTKTVTETEWEWETINDIKAIWLRDKDEIEEKLKSMTEEDKRVAIEAIHTVVMEDIEAGEKFDNIVLAACGASLQSLALHVHPRCVFIILASLVSTLAKIHITEEGMDEFMADFIEAISVGLSLKKTEDSIIH